MTKNQSIKRTQRMLTISESRRAAETAAEYATKAAAYAATERDARAVADARADAAIFVNMMKIDGFFG